MISKRFMLLLRKVNSTVYPILPPFAKSLLNILTNKLNRGERFKLLFNYFSWYLYHKPRQHTYQITLQNGMKSIVYPDSDSGVSNIFTKNVEFYEIAFVRKVLKKGDFIIDLGCNVGNRTLALADIVGGALLIDANEKSIERLKTNFKLNNLDMSNFYTISKAVGSKKGKIQFTDIGGTCCQNKIIGDEDTSNFPIKIVEMTTLDYEIDKIGNPSCSFIKTDLEGHDLDALTGAIKTLQNNDVKLVMFERWQTIPLQPFIDFFNNLNWIVFTLDSNGIPATSKKIIESSSNLFAMPECIASDFLGMKTGWSSRTYEEGDEQNIFDLVRAVWGDQVPEKEQWIKGWKWMFADNPAGSSIIWLAEHDGKIIGEYPLVMADMKIGDKIVKTGQIADTMTNPEYRRQGIAFTLGREALSQLRGQGAYIAFGFPTAEAYPLHIKTGWLDICAVQTMFKPLNLRNLLGEYFTCNMLLLGSLSAVTKLLLKTVFRAKNPPKVEGLTIAKLSYFDDRFNDFWEQISNDYNIIVVRNKSYLNWRYVDVPNAKYTIYVAEKDNKVCGYMVLEHRYLHRLMVGHILDIIAPQHQQNVVQCLISKALEHFEQEKADVVISEIVANRYRKEFLKNGFVPYPRSKNCFIAYNASPDIPDEFLKNPKNWFIQLGDLPMVY